MPSLKYFRPKTIEEALSLLEQGSPLAGGTTLTPNRYRLDTVVDLQDLPLGALESKADMLEAGAGCTLQQIVEADSLVPAALADACRSEAAWNLRNMATLGGAVVTAAGGSTLAAALLALAAEVHSLPMDRWLPLDEYLEARTSDAGHRLLTGFRWPSSSTLRFIKVGRSPADKPVILAALGRAPDGAYRVVLGGWGPRPIRVLVAEQALAAGDVAGAGRAAAQACAAAGDAWASAEYRAEIAGVLVRRLAAEDNVPSEARGAVSREPRGKVPSEAKGKA
jgi:CO/xanthine dehydrogenase FAD-binding subunit